MSTLLWLISTPFRLAGYVFVLAAFGAGFHDLFQSVSQDRLVLTPLGELWFRLSADSLNLAQAAIQRGVHPKLWDPVIQTLLGLPGWLSLFILATITLLIAQLIYRPR
ncbi:MAG: hypothetical protein ROR55_05595 [Devosia sp.]